MTTPTRPMSAAVACLLLAGLTATIVSAADAWNDVDKSRSRSTADRKIAAQTVPVSPFAHDGPSDRFADQPTVQSQPTPPAVMDMKQRPLSEQEILAALDEPTEMEFIETPLQDVVGYLQDRHGIQIKIDTSELKRANLGDDSPITQSVEGITLRSGLNLILRPLDLAYLVIDEVLLITTRQAAEAHQQTHIYSLHSLSPIDPEALADTIRASIHPGTWYGGNLLPAGTRDPDAVFDAKADTRRADARRTQHKGTVSHLPGVLVVTHNPMVQARIVDLLSQLQNHQKIMRDWQSDP